MRKVILFIAMSVDGYIADKNGKVDWLSGQNENEETIDTYSKFIQDIDTVIMGWNTYHQITTELSRVEWPYAHLTSYVITHKKLPSANMIYYTEKEPLHLIRELKKEQGKAIWICGGASIAQQLIEANLIDEYYLSIIPTILGSGIRLFNKTPEELKLKLVSTTSNNGIVELIYKRSV